MNVESIFAIGLAVVVLFVTVQVSRIIRMRILHATLRKSVESGHPLSPELVCNLTKPKAGYGDQRTGFLLIALACALVVSAAISGSNDFRDLIALSIFPFFVGAALLLRIRLSRSRRIEP